MKRSRVQEKVTVAVTGHPPNGAPEPESNETYRHRDCIKYIVTSNGLRT